jgi:7-cyano-7-deazaguanine synthase in queuosine biosynthesis
MMPARNLPLRRLTVFVLAAWALAACAADGAGTRKTALSVSSGDLPAIPICREEMRAYIEITKLAKLHGEGWMVYAPAVDALKQQILDCLDDKTGSGAFHAL